MKRGFLLVGLGLFVLAVGCNPNGRLNILRGPDKQPLPPNSEVPTVAALVNYMDENALKLQSLKCMDVGLTAQNGLIPFNAPGKMVCQRPRNFKMTAGNPLTHQDEVDLGSNDQEFWFWIRRAEPPQGLKIAPQFHCSYESLQAGKVRHIPFPFQPDWIMEALGMGQYGPATRYETQLVVEAEKLKLIEKTRSPQGVAIRKVTVFNRRRAVGTNPQITDYLLEEEASGKVICAAHVTEVQFDSKNGAIFPRRLELVWPEQKLKLGMVLNGVEVNPQLPQAMFVRRPMTGIPSMDLATGAIDNGVLRAQGFQR